ncbi:MAG: SMP-30/gluconolactonase/LRE family protein [Acidobacteria bacterium]|nr:SMP-30/gluconolactonase/LRE family protein [Acidobacteriota bacterium]
MPVGSAWAQRGGGQSQLPPARDVTVTGIPGVVADGARWAIAWQGTDNADGIVGMPDGSLLFAQEQPNRVSRLAPDDRVSVYLEDTHGTGALSLDASGRLLAVQRTCTDPGGQPDQCTEPTAVAVLQPERRSLATAFNGRNLGRVNDLVAARNGSIYFTSGGAFHLDTRGIVTSLGENIRSNGIMLSPDERVLYVTNGNTVLAFDVGADGATTNRRDFATLVEGSTGDGLAVDAEGRLYVTSQPGVQVFSATGASLGLIPTPRNAITVAFAGADKRVLYIVGSGAALGPGGGEFVTPPGVRNNAKTIYRLPMLAAGYAGRAK